MPNQWNIRILEKQIFLFVNFNNMFSPPHSHLNLIFYTFNIICFIRIEINKQDICKIFNMNFFSRCRHKKTC